jgi:hypothetical protein
MFTLLYFGGCSSPFALYANGGTLPFLPKEKPLFSAVLVNFPVCLCPDFLDLPRQCALALPCAGCGFSRLFDLFSRSPTDFLAPKPLDKPHFNLLTARLA